MGSELLVSNRWIVGGENLHLKQRTEIELNGLFEWTKRLKRDTAGRRPGEKHIQSAARYTHCHTARG